MESKEQFIHAFMVSDVIQYLSKVRGKNVQLARGAIMINEFLRNPHFSIVL